MKKMEIEGKLKGQQNKESAAVYLTNGEKICEITAPQSWRKYIGIPLFPLPLSIHETNTWKSPDAVVRLAWAQALTTCIEWAKLGVHYPGRQTTGMNCIHCGKASIIFHTYRSLFGKRTDGITCSNRDCSMYNVVIPWEMFKHMNEMPSEYIPDNFKREMLPTVNLSQDKT